MNISQTQDLLSWLWSKFPNGKTLSADDKRSTVVAYFDELWQYSLEDVIAAVRKALAAQPHFVPSAPEIAHYCTKTIDVEKYLPREYAQLEKALAAAKAKYQAFEVYSVNSDILHEFNMHVCCYPGNLTPELQQERDELQAKRDAEFSKSEANFAENDRLRAACDVISNQMAEMMSQAYDKACRAYTDTQRKLAIPDLQKLGIPQSQAALEG